MKNKKFKWIAGNEELSNEEVLAVLKEKFIEEVGLMPPIQILSGVICTEMQHYLKKYAYSKQKYLLVLKQLNIAEKYFFESIVVPELLKKSIKGKPLPIRTEVAVGVSSDLEGIKNSRTIQDFQKQYPMSTSGDLQTFVLGYQAAVKDINERFQILS